MICRGRKTDNSKVGISLANADAKLSAVYIGAALENLDMENMSYIHKVGILEKVNMDLVDKMKFLKIIILDLG